MIARAAKTSVGLSLLFLTVYPACNWLTSLRHDVGTCYWPWERAIPYLPILIIPYLSIDLFFVTAPFLCRTRRELETLTWRMTAAILIAGVCFLLFPMRFAFDRPPATGPIGAIFNSFRTLDLPYNEFPSLHIALALLVARIYIRHTRGLWRGLLIAWFALIVVSTVFTYQHHVADVLGGAALAWVCAFLFREDARAPALQNARAGILYLAGMALFVSLAWSFQPRGLLLLWPAAALGVLGAWYFGLGAGRYPKRNGRLGLDTWGLMAPVLLGQWISWLGYRRCSAPWNVLTDHVWIGRRLAAPEAQTAIRSGVTAVLDLAGEFSETPAFRRTRYLALPLLDLTAPSPDALHQALAFIDRESPHGIVYIHCKAGYSRTAAIAGAWLLTTGRAGSADEAAALLRAARPGMIIRPEAMAALHAAAQQLPVVLS